ncbi:hypothetical protein SAMN05421742_1175 [Roseospirillum parvum]|uniref:DUF1641 domain-containing protein n=2 Tax=Roseospirillum parvum TaxID=83401 RepID=A0A1G8FWE2_9PROT|nr:hypothetical protein SAMN05421742_1175 [Roseospirillum parvum]
MGEEAKNMSDMAHDPTAAAAADLARLSRAASDALTDNMVERLSTNAGNLMEVLDLLNDEDTREAVMAAVAGLTELHRVGALQTLIDLAQMIHGARSAVTDNMVERMFAFVEHMVNNLANEEVATLAHETRGALEDALDDTRAAGNTGMLTTLKMLSDKETQRSLQFLMHFGMRLRSRVHQEALEEGK